MIIFAGIIAGSCRLRSVGFLNWCGPVRCIPSPRSSSASWVLVTAFVVFVERGQRKILVNYAKRQVG